MFKIKSSIYLKRNKNLFRKTEAYAKIHVYATKLYHINIMPKTLVQKMSFQKTYAKFTPKNLSRKFFSTKIMRLESCRKCKTKMFYEKNICQQFYAKKFISKSLCQNSKPIPLVPIWLLPQLRWVANEISLRFLLPIALFLFVLVPKLLLPFSKSLPKMKK